MAIHPGARIGSETHLTACCDLHTMMDMRRTGFLMVALALACYSREAPAGAVAVRDAVVVYHVAPSGSDQNPGSQDLPFGTIAKAAGMARPGDTVMVHAGTYREWVQPARGGDSDARRITYRAAAGERVVIKGSERISGWKDLGEGVWKVDLDDSYFAPNNWYPFRDLILGKDEIGIQWLGVGRWCHKGEVFLNENRYREAKTLDECLKSTGAWFTSRKDSTQSIYANFGQSDPNRELAEITVRHAVFGKDVQDGIDYITVDGFVLMQSSEEWLPTYAEPNSRGVIFTSGSDWTIQNCTVSLAKMRGIVTDRGRNHLVRNNTIRKCGSAGIAGADTEGIVISGNWIEDIHENQPYTGAEHGGIKYHTSRNMIISGNIISNVHALEDFGDKGMGIWLDWPKGNNRITGNVVVDCTGRGLMVENPFGPHLIDNNILIHNQWPSHFEDGNVVVHNLFHSTALSFRAGWWGRTYHLSNKLWGNLFFKDASTLVKKPGNKTDYNAYLDGAKRHGFGDAHSVSSRTPPQFSYIVDRARKTVTLSFTLDSAAADLNCPMTTTEFIGVLTIGKISKEKGKQPEDPKSMVTSTMTHPGGTPLSVDRDFYQLGRDPEAVAGPFRKLVSGVNTFVLRPNSDFDDQAR